MGSIRNGSYYTIVDGPTWTQAEANAVALGGHLVTINDADENEWLGTLTTDPTVQFWIGYSDAREEGRWEWADGSTSAYTNWYLGGDLGPEPNNGSYHRIEPFAGGEDHAFFVQNNWYYLYRTTGTNRWGDGYGQHDHGSWLNTGIAEIPLSYFSISDRTVTEGSSGIVTITRTGGTLSTQNLTLTFSNATATAGSDYTATNITVSFGAGETSRTVSINTLDDSVVESSETFNLTLTASSSDAVPAQISDGTALITITDNDTPTYSINTSFHQLEKVTP